MSQVSSTRKGGGFFKVHDVDASYWGMYLDARPKYEKNNFYSLIWNYHASQRHDNKANYEIAHDIGTGPGQVAAELASRFRSVVASDSNVTHLEVARQRTKVAENIVYKQHSAEEIGSAHECGSADLVCAAECLPLINAEKALASFSRLLRPGGTLAIWFYGRPHFVSAKSPSAASSSQYVVQKIFGEIVDMSFRRVISAAPSNMKTGFELSADRMESWLDDISLPPSHWKSVQRRKWNTDAYMSFIGRSALDRPIRVSSAVRDNETVQESSDPAFWAEEWNIDGIKQFVRVLLPAFKTDDPALDARIEKKWTELEIALGGKAATWNVTWPVVLILATRV